MAKLLFYVPRFDMDFFLDDINYCGNCFNLNVGQNFPCNKCFECGDFTTSYFVSKVNHSDGRLLWGVGEMFKWLKGKLKQIFDKKPITKTEEKFQGFKYKEDHEDIFRDDYYDYH